MGEFEGAMHVFFTQLNFCPFILSVIQNVVIPQNQDLFEVGVKIGPVGKILPLLVLVAVKKITKKEYALGSVAFNQGVDPLEV